MVLIAFCYVYTHLLNSNTNQREREGEREGGREGKRREGGREGGRVQTLRWHLHHDIFFPVYA